MSVSAIVLCDISYRISEVSKAVYMSFPVELNEPSYGIHQHKNRKLRDAEGGKKAEGWKSFKGRVPCNTTCYINRCMCTDP